MDAQSDRRVAVGNMVLGNNLPLVLISGPCQIESSEHSLMMASELAEAAQQAGIGFIFKSSFDKANRTSISGIRGPGIAEGLDILARVKERIGCPVVTDVHEPDQCRAAAGIVDMLQIPAFLCRQTDLLVAAGQTGAAVNVKKGQFLAPWDMQHAAAKIASTGNQRVLLCERGTSFGYNRLICDMRSLSIMARTGYPVVMDATHSVQEPGGDGERSGGERKFAPLLARAAVAVGVAALFIEVHDDPDHAPSDGANMIPLSEISALLRTLVTLDRTVKSGWAEQRDFVPCP